MVYRSTMYFYQDRKQQQWSLTAMLKPVPELDFPLNCAFVEATIFNFYNNVKMQPWISCRLPPPKELKFSYSHVHNNGEIQHIQVHIRDVFGEPAWPVYAFVDSSEQMPTLYSAQISSTSQCLIVLSRAHILFGGMMYFYTLHGDYGSSEELLCLHQNIAIYYFIGRRSGGFRVSGDFIPFPFRFFHSSTIDGSQSRHCRTRCSLVAKQYTFDDAVIYTKESDVEEWKRRGP